MKKNESIKYQIGRSLSSTVFNLTLYPKIIDKNFIPDEGRMILCGNHLHVWDQFPVMCSTSRTIHWLAKKEYFEGKLGPIFKFMECIPVDRAGDTKKSKNIAIEYLNKDSAVGIFPEGTRNGLKDKYINELYNKYIDDRSFDDFFTEIKKESPRLSQTKFLENLFKNKVITKKELVEALYDVERVLIKYRDNGLITDFEYQDSKLLPMYSGAVNMAKLTGAIIVPFAVSGTYKIGNDDLTVAFSKPISVENINHDEAMYLLRSSICNKLNEIETPKVYKKQ